MVGAARTASGPSTEQLRRAAGARAGFGPSRRVRVTVARGPGVGSGAPGGGGCHSGGGSR